MTIDNATLFKVWKRIMDGPNKSESRTVNGDDNKVSLYPQLLMMMLMDDVESIQTFVGMDRKLISMSLGGCSYCIGKANLPPPSDKGFLERILAVDVPLLLYYMMK